MDIASLPKVECAVLHKQFEPLENNAILDHIQTLAEELGFVPEVQLMESAEHIELNVHIGGKRVVVKQFSSPVSATRFESVLATPYATAIMPKAQDIVVTHQCHTVVSITRGMFELSPEAALFTDAPSSSIGFNTYDDVFRAMVLCREIVKFIIAGNPAMAVHWLPSDNLVPQDFFERNCEGDMMLLNVRPSLASSSGRIVEGSPLSMTLTGSQWLVGRMIEFEEAAVSFPWLMEVSLAFIMLCQKRGAVLSHLDSFEIEDKDWRVGVVHDSGSRTNSWEDVRLVVIHAPEFGILGDTDSRFTVSPDNKASVRNRKESEAREIQVANDALYEEPARLNPADMMDLAILEKLKKRDAPENTPYKVVEKTVEATLPVQDDLDFSLEKEKTFHPKNEPWTGNAKKADINKLRELVKSGSETGGNMPAEEDSKGFLKGKIGGMFARR